MIFRSKFPLLYFSPLLLFILAPLSGWSLLGNILAFLGVALVCLFVLIWLCVRYELSDEGLCIQDGLSSEHSVIRYSLIDAVEKRDGFVLELISGLSFKRVAIIVDGKVRVQVSPADRDGFIEELQRRIDACKG